MSKNDAIRESLRNMLGDIHDQLERELPHIERLNLEHKLSYRAAVAAVLSAWTILRHSLHAEEYSENPA